MKREIRIVVERERTVQVVEAGISDGNWCDACAAPTATLTIEMAAAVACVGNGAIRYWMDNTGFHHQQTPTGQLRICHKSFLEHLNRLNFAPGQDTRRNAEDHRRSQRRIK